MATGPLALASASTGQSGSLDAVVVGPAIDDVAPLADVAVPAPVVAEPPPVVGALVESLDDFEPPPHAARASAAASGSAIERGRMGVRGRVVGVPP